MQKGHFSTHFNIKFFIIYPIISRHTSIENIYYTFNKVTLSFIGYRLNHGYCRIPPTCLATSAHLANFDEDTDDTSSYTSSDYSDYDNDEDDDDVSGSEYGEKILSF